MANSNKKKTAALSAVDQKIIAATGEEAFYSKKARTKGSHQESKEESAMKPEMKSLYEKIVASTGNDYTEELAKAVSREALVYRALMGLFGRGGFRYEKTAIKGSKGGGFKVEFKAPEDSDMASILSKGGEGTPFKLEHGGKSYEGANIAAIKAKMGGKKAVSKPAAKKSTKKAAPRKK